MNSALEQDLREINEALLVSSVHQHELAEQAQQAEAALRISESQLRQIADSMPQMVWTARPDGYVDYYNERWYEYTGFPHNEFGQSSWEPILHPDDVRQCMDTYFGCIREGQPYHIEYRFKDRAAPVGADGGGYRWFMGRALPLRDERGEIVRWFGTWTDIDDVKQMEKKTQEQATALADLHRRKDEFLAMLSHELRNPLSPILNAVQLLRLEKNESGLQRQARTIIERQVGQLTRLIDDLLEVSRISTGRIHLHEERLDLRTVVERAVETVRPLISQRRHALSLALPLAPIWLHADATRLEQVVVNLLNNAAKYTPEGGQLWVGLQQDGDQAVLRVRDTGEGIAPEVLPRIFDLFTQAERSLDRSQGGLGIGLALVKTLVEMHRGRVEAFSALGHGSEFVVRLPLLVSSILPAPPPVEKTESAMPAPLRVLVVDDNVDAAQTLAMLLNLFGHETRIAHTGSAALEEADAFQPDVVLLDIGLPQMNGYEVARRMRLQPRLKSTVLVALTGYGQESDRQLSKEAGFDHHLVKPADFGKLKKILASVSERAK